MKFSYDFFFLTKTTSIDVDNFRLKKTKTKKPKIQKATKHKKHKNKKHTKKNTQQQRGSNKMHKQKSSISISVKKKKKIVCVTSRRRRNKLRQQIDISAQPRLDKMFIVEQSKRQKQKPKTHYFSNLICNRKNGSQNKRTKKKKKQKTFPKNEFFA